MNYSELVAEIQSYVENQFTTTDINTFIQQAEQRVYNTVQLPAFRKNVTGTLTIGNSYLTMPTDWLATFSLAVITAAGEYQYLLNKDVNFIRAAYPTPTPDYAYTAELHYYYYPESIVTAGTTWLGDNFDSVLLYGSLLEAYTFMKGETDVITVYQARYQEAMSLLKQLGDGKDRRDAYRSGQVRYPVQ